MGAVLHEFERHKQMKEITPMEDSGKGEIEEPAALKYKITDVFTPAIVFDILFGRILLFKLVCIREEWPDLYEQILSEEKMQTALIHLQKADTENEISEYMSELGTSPKRIKEILEGGLLDFLKDSPEFNGIADIKTYLTLLEISTPETGKLSLYEEPWELPINLFNRYMMFERINRGKVEEETIEEKINKLEWRDKLNCYFFFSVVLDAFGYVNLRTKLIESLSAHLSKDKKNFTEKIKASTDIGGFGWLYYAVSGLVEEPAKELESARN